MHPVAQPHPFQKLGDVLLIIALLAPHDAKRKRDILPGGQVIEQPEILENDPDAPPEVRALRGRILGNISSEKVDEAARGTQRHVQEPEKRRFTGA